MNKNIIIGLVIVILLLVGGGGYMFLNRSQTNPQTTSTQPAENTTQTTSKASLKSLMSLGNNQTCTFEDTQSGSSGTVYISSGKFRGDFSSNVNGTVTGSHMISDSSNVYVWMDNTNDGFKMSMDSIEKLNESNQKTVDINKEVDYSCSGWGVDSSKFSIPTQITFQDFSAMMEDASKMMKSVTGTSQDNTAACSTCNNLPAEAQAQCKAALKCN